MQGIFSWLCLCRLAVAGRRVFGPATQAIFLLLSCLQFHIPFYVSRTLPNVFAFGPVVLACAHWLDGTQVWIAPALLTAVTVITRCDMLLLVACVSLALLAMRRMSLLQLLAVGGGSAVAALVATVAFDSLIWGRPLWPEGEVLWFNTVLNKCGAAPFSGLPHSDGAPCVQSCRSTCFPVSPTCMRAPWLLHRRFPIIARFIHIFPVSGVELV